MITTTGQRPVYGRSTVDQEESRRENIKVTKQPPAPLRRMPLPPPAPRAGPKISWKRGGR